MYVFYSRARHCLLLIVTLRMVPECLPERLRSSAVETPSWPMRPLTALATSARASSAGASFDTNSSALCSGHRLADRQPFLTCRGGGVLANRLSAGFPGQAGLVERAPENEAALPMPGWTPVTWRDRRK